MSMSAEQRAERQREYARLWRAANPEKAREIRNRNNRLWRAAHPEKVRAINLSVKDRARRTLCRAVYAGRVVKPDVCGDCGKHFARRLLHGHHWHGYSQPLDVQWLCALCHYRAHKEEGS